MTNLVPGKNDYWFLPLGGAGEIGMNLNLFGHDGQWLMVDLGVTFWDRYGIQIVTPDPGFILEHKDKLVGLVVTHAHEDHIGAIPYLWPLLKCPVYATPFTMQIIREKIKQYPWAHSVPLIEVPLCGTVQVGAFKVEYITLTHSIPEPNALAITTPLGTLLHTGDWKIDHDPLVGEATDHNRLTEIGDAGVLAMICDSTNVFAEGHSGSESTVREELKNVIASHKKGRVVVACFASNIARMESAALAGQACGRKVALVGRSLHRMLKAAKDTGYLKDFPPIITEDEAMRYNPEEVMFICTGSQGEPRAALTRITNDNHPSVSLDFGDTVIFSSRVIPGNERSISAIQNSLVRKGVTVITAGEEDIHVSGHPARGELRQMYAWVRPQMLIPVHGEARHMHEQARLGHSCGITQVAVPHNGSLIAMDPNGPHHIKTVHNGRWCHDGERMIPLESHTVKERGKMSVNGVVNVSFCINRHGILQNNPQTTIYGITHGVQETENLNVQINRLVRQMANASYKDDRAMEEAIAKAVSQAVRQQFDKRPMVTVHILQI